MSSPPVSWCVVGVLAHYGCRHIIQVDAAHWWWLRRSPPPILCKALWVHRKALYGLGPRYMSDMLTEYKPNRPLRSLGSSQLEIPRVHTKQGESAFSYYAARSWNQLPEEIRCAKTLATFKSRLKTHLFSCAFVEWALCYVRTDCIVFYVFLFNCFKSHFKSISISF